MKMAPSRFLPIMVLSIGISPVHTQWVKTAGPQGVRSLVSGSESGSSGISSTTVMAGTDSGIYRSLDTGSTWVSVNTGLTNTMIRALVATNAGRRDSNGLFAGTAGGGVYRSTNGGSSWFPVNSGLTNLQVNALSFSAGAGTLYAGTDGGIFRTTNNGNSWEPLNTGLPNTAIRAIAAESSPLYAYAGTEGQGIFRITGTTTWAATNTGLTSLNVRYVLQYLLVAATDSGIFKSTNNGTTWTGINNGLTNRSARVLLLAPGVFAEPVVAGTDGGVFFANIAFYPPPVQSPGNWVAYNEGLTDLNVRALALTEVQKGYLFVGTNNGIWRRPASQVIPEYTDVINRPTRRLRADASGPLSFTISQPMTVSLKILDLSGKELSVLFEKGFAAGTHKVDLKKVTLPNGVYLFRLRTGSATETQKVLLSR